MEFNLEETVKENMTLAMKYPCFCIYKVFFTNLHNDKVGLSVVINCLFLYIIIERLIYSCSEMLEKNKFVITIKKCKYITNSIKILSSL